MECCILNTRSCGGFWSKKTLCFGFVADVPPDSNSTGKLLCLQWHFPAQLCISAFMLQTMWVSYQRDPGCFLMIGVGFGKYDSCFKMKGMCHHNDAGHISGVVCFELQWERLWWLPLIRKYEVGLFSIPHSKRTIFISWQILFVIVCECCDAW